MNIRSVLTLLTTVALSTAISFAAGIDGKWTAEMQGRDGQTRTQTYNFKSDGTKLTGTIESPMGEREIQEGTVNGDEASWVMTFDRGGEPVKIKYTGKITGNEMKIKIESPRGTREIVAKRVTT